MIPFFFLEQSDASAEKFQAMHDEAPTKVVEFLPLLKENIP